MNTYKLFRGNNILDPMMLHPTEVVTYRDVTNYVDSISTPQNLEMIRRGQIQRLVERIYNDNNLFTFTRGEEDSPFKESIVSIDIVVR